MLDANHFLFPSGSTSFRAILSKIGVLTAALLGALSTTLACLGYEGGLPKATSNKQISAPIYVKSGEVFDGGWAKYDRNPTSCREQVEGGGGCNIEFVWFEDVCEDAISIKNDKAGDVTWIVGGGAYHAADKIIQHNGCGRVNCEKCAREVYIEGATARNGGEVAGITKANGDKATLVNVCTDTKMSRGLRAE
ncbi:polysaccharide lyase family 3 [Colletotrichum salicis]|uniref:Pectate lyase n=1 Tax=Colletotrichum salicis TaxID=1209931 RepID=A0A135V7M6_9PEZI|nr:polysaccharide lyase family 3 [Colletotrichum salicis]